MHSLPLNGASIPRASLNGYASQKALVMTHSSSSPSKKTQTVKFRGTFQTKETFELVAKISRNHQQKIELSINNLQNKRRNIIQVKMEGKNQAAKNQTKDLKCTTHLLSEKFRNMRDEKKATVRDLRFGGLMHIPLLRVHHKILKELATFFKLGKNTLEIGYGSFKVRPRIIGAALGINASGSPHVQEDFHPLYTDGVPVTNHNKQNLPCAPDYNLKKKKAIDGYLFVLMIVYFNLSKHKDKKGEERLPEPWIANWTREQLVERMRAEMEEHMGIVKMAETKEKMKEIKKKKQKTKKTKKGRQVHHHHLRLKQLKVKSILPLNLRLKKTQRIQQGNNPPEKSKKRLLLTFRSEESSLVERQKTMKKTQRTPQKTQYKKKKVIVEDSSPEQAKSYHGYRTLSEIGTEELDEFLRKKNEKSTAQGEKEADMRSTKAHYVSSETISDVNLGSNDPSSQGHTDQSSVNKPAESMLSLVVESASEPAEENMMVVRVETQSQTEALSIVLIQVCLPLSQTTTVSEIEQISMTENEPTPVPEIEPTPEGTTKSTPKPPEKPEESTPTLPPAPSKINLAPEDVAALMMMAQTAFQEDAATQEGAATQDGERAKTPETPKLLEQLGDLVEKIASGGVTTKGKSPQIRKESGGESFEKFETPARMNENMADMKEKCYIWAIRVKTYGNGLTNEFDTVCTLQAQDRYILSKVHLASLAAETHIEIEIFSAMCLILNQEKIKRFQEEVYCLSLILW
ncbi:uncharacterized protein DS421_19g643070 [Arachis hypogaea]|uniref:Uncharacterized protein n=1 Tax=Arachis hypogaea TaxID=3818 RepID=A0A6B9V4H3_ARAHY|nr:uncharacterized protein DS421_19g643070 [Arachis hypogaea]